MVEKEEEEDQKEENYENKNYENISREFEEKETRLLLMMMNHQLKR